MDITAYVMGYYYVIHTVRYVLQCLVNIIGNNSMYIRFLCRMRLCPKTNDCYSRTIHDKNRNSDVIVYVVVGNQLQYCSVSNLRYTALYNVAKCAKVCCKYHRKQ